MLIIEALLFLLALVVAITLHEAAHCFAADYLGDPTPRALGRTTLDPRVHLDPLGSLILPFLGYITGSPILFGWGRPAPFDPYNLQRPRRDTAIIALAGPASNLLLAICFSLLLHLHPLFSVSSYLILLIQLNVSVALFNLLPIPPLDGSKIIGAPALSGKSSYLLVFLFILPIFGGSSLASLILSPLFNFFLNLLIPAV